MSVHRLVYIPRQVFSLSAFGFIGSATETPASQAALASQADSQDADRRDHAEMNAAQVKQMHPADIQAALKKKGASQQSVADQAGVTHSCVSHVIRGRGKSRRVADLVAAVTGIPVEKLWPGEYR
jgi:lambda repressor-like predicted transcriptional regulator